MTTYYSNQDYFEDNYMNAPITYAKSDAQIATHVHKVVEQELSRAEKEKKEPENFWGGELEDVAFNKSAYQRFLEMGCDATKRIKDPVECDLSSVDVGKEHGTMGYITKEEAENIAAKAAKEYPALDENGGWKKITRVLPKGGVTWNRNVINSRGIATGGRLKPIAKYADIPKHSDYTHKKWKTFNTMSVGEMKKLSGKEIGYLKDPITGIGSAFEFGRANFGGSHGVFLTKVGDIGHVRVPNTSVSVWKNERALIDALRKKAYRID